MKYATLLTTALILIFWSPLAAQNVIQISQGENRIDEAVFEAEAGDIIELTTNGGYYYELFDIVIDKPLTIRAAEGLTKKPKWVSDASSMIEVKDDLTIEGIMLAGVIQSEPSSRAIRASGDDVKVGYTLIIDNVDFYNFSGEAIRGYADTQAELVQITNSRFIDIGGRAIRFRDDPQIEPGSVKNLIIENSTFWKVDSEIVYVEDHDGFLATPGPYFRMKNVTIHNTSNSRPIYARYTDNVELINVIITNEEEGGVAAQIYGEDTVVDYMMYTNVPNGFEKRSDASVDSRTIYRNVDPLFAAPFSGNFRLTENSPAIGAGLDGASLGDQRWWNDTPGRITIDGFFDDWATLEPLYVVEESDPAIDDRLEMHRVWFAIDDHIMAFRMDFFDNANWNPGDQDGAYDPFQRWHRVVFRDIDGGDKYDYRLSSYLGTVNEESFTRARHRLRSSELAYTNNEYDGERMPGQIAWSEDGLSMEAHIPLDSLYVTDGETTYFVMDDDSLQIRFHIEAGDPRNFLPAGGENEDDRTIQGGYFRINMRDYYVGDPVAEPIEELELIPTSGDIRAEIPQAYSLDQNYPNPFNPTTSISFTLPEASDVTLEVFNLLGQKVATIADRHYNSGTHTVQFDASRLASGTYLYRLSTENFTETRSMMLIK
jgi:hypothetical protein